MPLAAFLAVLNIQKARRVEKIFFRKKKKAYGGTTVDPHMPIFLYEKSFFGPAGFSTAKNSQKGPQTHLGLLPLLQQCSGNGISTATARGPPYGHFFLRKKLFSAQLDFPPSRTAKKTPKTTRACFHSYSSALATVFQLPQLWAN